MKPAKEPINTALHDKMGDNKTKDISLHVVKYPRASLKNVPNQ